VSPVAILISAGVGLLCFFLGILWEVFWAARRRDRVLEALRNTMEERSRGELALMRDCELLADELHKVTGGDYRGERVLGTVERHRLVRLITDPRETYSGLSGYIARPVKTRKLEPRVTPEDFKRLKDMADDAKTIDSTLAAIKSRHGL
jgi:hypothetical protein